MTPIVIDLEWNHAMPGRRPVDGLPNEIIQIGAARIDDGFNVVSTFSELIKPCYYPRLCKDITELTLIKDADLEGAAPFLQVMEAFRDWCGTGYVFVSWGPNDILELRRNCDKFGFATDWIADCFDAQLMFDDMKMQEDRNWPLNYALYHFNEKPAGAHNALADVLSTVSVLKHLDLTDGLEDEYYKVIVDDGL
ncbi:MAG: exonuclease domain-containing protein [Firmicutes bacterium]|nr:exonuclease domain-containing protein [Bacillota bacterium]